MKQSGTGTYTDQSKTINELNVNRISTINCMAVLLTTVALPSHPAAQPTGLPPPASQSPQAPPRDPLPSAASRWDLNQDGVFTCDEWKQFVTGVFARVDKNRDGFLSATEFQDMRVSERFFASADISYFDDDQDRRVSKNEFIDKPSPFFARYDLNRDCRVTTEEMKGPSTNLKKDQGPAGKGGPMGMPGKGAF